MTSFLKNGKKMSLNHAQSLPGYEITVTEEIMLPSVLSNSFFKGINVLALPKMLKVGRSNPDLQSILEPVAVQTGIQAGLADNQVLLFVPDSALVREKRLHIAESYFGNGQLVTPLFINLGLKDVRLKAGSVLGTVMILNTEV